MRIDILLLVCHEIISKYENNNPKFIASTHFPDVKKLEIINCVTGAGPFASSRYHQLGTQNMPFGRKRQQKKQRTLTRGAYLPDIVFRELGFLFPCSLAHKPRVLGRSHPCQFKAVWFGRLILNSKSNVIPNQQYQRTSCTCVLRAFVCCEANSWRVSNKTRMKVGRRLRHAEISCSPDFLPMWSQKTLQVTNQILTPLTSSLPRTNNTVQHNPGAETSPRSVS